MTNAASFRLTFYSDAPYYGGAERYLVTLARQYARLAEGPSLAAIVEVEDSAERLASEFEEAGVSVTRFPGPGFGWWKQLPQLVALFRSVPGDVLHVNLPSSYDAGVSSIAWAAKQAGYRAVVSTEHLPMVERKYKKFPVKFLFSHWIDRVIAIAEANREFLVHRHGVDSDRVVALPNGIEEPAPLTAQQIDRLRREWGAKDRAVVGCVGRMTERKGQHHLLAAVARVDEALRPLVVLVGEGEEEARLRELAGELELDAVFTGPRSDAASLAQAFDVFALVSSIETMPLTILEAMAGGVPVLATSIFGVPELVQDRETGRLVPPGDVVETARVLEEMLASPEALQAMGRAGRQRYEQCFTASRMAERTLEVYQSALASAPHTGGSGHVGNGSRRTSPGNETAA
ncbi:MAG: glycosyltransferase family 4 protein [Candidatus Eisenbacteria bacterium]